MATLEIGTPVKIETSNGIINGTIVPAWRNDKACFGVQYENGGYNKFSRKTGKAYASRSNDKIILNEN